MRPLAGKAICRKCHPRCKRCTSYGFHEQACQKCALYKRGEQCEDECPTDHYVDEVKSECFPCDSECRGCTGPGADNCLQCRTLKVFSGDPTNTTSPFNCTGTCPPDYPYQIFPPDQVSPFCSAVAVSSGSLEQTAETPAVLVGALVGLVVVVVICGAIMFYCSQKTKDSKEAAMMTKVLCEDSEPLRPSNVGPNLTKLRIIKEQELRRGGQLGMGAFGAVYKGVWILSENNKLPVAIKIPLEMSGPQASKDFLEEAYIMASVDHPNLLNLLAVCMTSEMMFVTQLMPLGSLLDYVKTNKDRTGSKALLNWSTQIARGMAYLEERRLVHRDLAARNVLVKNASLVKITDFGLAKLLTTDSDEYKAAGGKMPIKWLALECIRNRVFTSKSDVWAFGVTIWELLTFGQRPYGDHPAKDVPDLIEVGYKLAQPDICSLDVYITLVGCWNLDAGLRPSFKDLVEVFSTYARDPGRYLCVQGDKHMRLPSFTSQDEKDLIRNLPVMSEAEAIAEGEEYMQPKHGRQSSASGGQLSGSDPRSEQVPTSIRYCLDPMKQHGLGSDECDHKVCGAPLKLELPLDEDDYLMPSGPNGLLPSNLGAVGGAYMDLIGAPSCVENPEYLIGSMNPSSPAPTQTIGIPVAPLGVHIPGTPMSSDHEYYNDLQRELQPLHRSETTV